MTLLARPARTPVNVGARLVAVVALIVLVGAACSSSEDGKGGTSTTTGKGQGAPTLTDAVERTSKYFDTRPPRGDVGFLLGQGSLHLPSAFQQWSAAIQPDPQVTEATKDPKALQYLEAILWLGRSRPHHPLQPLQQPSVPPVENSSTLTDEELSGVTQVMASGLRCDQLTPEQRRAWLDSLAMPGHSYLLTHQLLSLVWGHDSGCLTDAEANPLRTTLATAVYSELLTDDVTVNDLSLERMAMLCYADLCDWVTDRQTNAVAAKQLPDGSWGDGSVPINRDAFVPPAHTAGLGFYVLAMKWNSAMRAPSPPR